MRWDVSLLIRGKVVFGIKNLRLHTDVLCKNDYGGATRKMCHCADFIIQKYG